MDLGLKGKIAIVTGGTPAEFAAHIKRELARWAQVIKQAKIKPD